MESSWTEKIFYYRPRETISFGKANSGLESIKRYRGGHTINQDANCVIANGIADGELQPARTRTYLRSSRENPKAAEALTVARLLPLKSAFVTVGRQAVLTFRDDV